MAAGSKAASALVPPGLLDPPQSTEHVWQLQVVRAAPIQTNLLVCALAHAQLLTLPIPRRSHVCFPALQGLSHSKVSALLRAAAFCPTLTRYLENVQVPVQQVMFSTAVYA